MADKIHIKIQQKDYAKLRAIAFKNNLSCSAVADVIGIYYANIGLKHEINIDILENIKETVLKIKTENNPYMQQVKSKMVYYSTVLYYYFNQSQLSTEERANIKSLNKKIAIELEKRTDPNALYNAIVRMNYRSTKERNRTCKK